MFLGDITFLNDGNESILGGLIHVQKFSKLAQVYLDIKRYQDIRVRPPCLFGRLLWACPCRTVPCV